jgi:acetamidase/formamidase
MFFCSLLIWFCYDARCRQVDSVCTLPGPFDSQRWCSWSIPDLPAAARSAQAQGIAKVAKAAGIERESLYRALSVHGNPRLSTLVAVTKAIGLRLTIEAAQ